MNEDGMVPRSRTANTLSLGLRGNLRTPLPSAEEREGATVQSFKPVHLLLVEDNPDDVMITQRALKRSRVTNDLSVCRDGQEALDFLLHRGIWSGNTARPDLILLDVNLPKVNGMDVLQQIRSTPELSLIPVIMLTASDREEDVVKSYRLGSNTYIQKPVEFDKFLHALEVLGEYWIVVAKLPAEAA
jgi:two-component system, response regulator